MSDELLELGGDVLPGVGDDPTLAASGDGEPEQYLAFALAGETFAVPVRHVREVLDLRKTARIANAPPLLLGMIDVRGQGIPVIDLARKLALPASGHSEHTRILVLEVGPSGRQLVIAAIVDAVHEVTQLAEAAIEPPPSFGEPWDASFMKGLGRRQGAFVTLLDLERLFRRDELELVAAAR
ncbi:chemotaxis protein CheW [Benzoatithermus flavus]|uniref:Chemotaxis protein CheW n=1 Tax=Benzoatithermus flavus TaxID=3108223 RepID=A0ABU8XXE4_9PROT